VVAVSFKLSVDNLCSSWTRIRNVKLETLQGGRF